MAENHETTEVNVYKPDEHGIETFANE